MSVDVRPRLCLVLPAHWAAQFGGAEYQVKLLLRRLVRDDAFDCTYLARAVDTSYTPEGYALRPIARCCFLGKYGYAFDWPSLKRHLTELRPDVIYQRVGGAYTGIVGRYAQRHGCRFVWHVAHDSDVQPGLRNTTPRNFLFRWLDKKLLEQGISRASAIVAQTEYQSKLLHKHYGRRATKVIRNFHPTEIPEAAPGPRARVLWVANLKPDKRPELFIELAERLRDVDAQFTMIGRNDDESRYAELVQRASQNGAVEYLGAQPVDTVNQLLTDADLLVSTSRAEGFPNTFIQAWLRGTPVLSLDVDPDQLLVREEIGKCCSSLDELEMQLRSLIKDRERGRELGRRARAYALANHSLRNIDTLIDLFRN